MEWQALGDSGTLMWLLSSFEDRSLFGLPLRARKGARIVARFGQPEIQGYFRGKGLGLDAVSCKVNNLRAVLAAWFFKMSTE
jgi:hypothetical protein